MKIGIIKGFASKNYYGGVSVQGRMWYEGLRNQGDDVFLLDNWSNYDWKSFDYILIIGLGNLFYDYIQLFKDYKSIKIVSAPIIDFTGSLSEFLIRGKFQGCNRLLWHTPYFDLYHCIDKISLFLVRSEHEKKFLVEGFKIPESRVRIIPLHTRFSNRDISFDLTKKENFVFHSSRLLSPGKNVHRLIKAAIKYNFNLVLSGTVNGENEHSKLYNWIGNHDNIKYIGRLSDEELIEYYKKAKVFALPSLVEGVGMVALESASYGCNIVLTNLGGPKEYFNNKAFLVNPFDVDDIGGKIIEALNDSSTQPYLSNHIINYNSEKYCMTLLHNTLLEFWK